MGIEILGIMGSPRKGNTEIMVFEVLEGAKSKGADTETINPRSMNIKLCNGCMESEGSAACVYDDDMREILKTFRAADHYVMGAPVYMMHINAVMKTFIERLYPLARYPEEPGPPYSRRDDGIIKNAVLVVTMGAPKDWAEAAGENAKSSMETILTLEGVMVSDTIYGCQGDPAARSIQDQEETLKKAYDAGSNLVKG